MTRNAVMLALLLALAPALAAVAQPPAAHPPPCPAAQGGTIAIRPIWPTRTQ